MYGKFEKNLEKYRKINKPEKYGTDIDEYELESKALLKALNDTFFWQFWAAGAAKLLSDVGLTMNPYLTRHLISFTMTPNGYIGEGVGYALGVSFLFMISAIFLNIFFYLSTLTGAQSRAVLIHAIYTKNLKISAKARLSFPNGKITNMLSTDCHRIDFAMGWFHFSWTFPVSIGISIAIVMVNIGAPGLIGFAVCLCAFFLIVSVGRNIVMGRKKISVITDSRVSLMREVLQSMKIIKFYSWEDAYLKKVTDIRNKETYMIFKLLALRNVLNAVFISVPTIAGLLSFILLSRTGGYLNPATVFSSLSIFNILRMPLMILPLSIISSTDAYQALKRIQSFLSAPEMHDYIERATFEELYDNAVVISKGSFIWETEDKEENEEKEKTETNEMELTRQLTDEHTKTASGAPIPAVEPINSTERSADEEDDDDSINEKSAVTEEHTDSHVKFPGFHNIDLNIKRGEFIIVTGTIGSGKSSLLSAIAGTMVKTTGSVKLGGDLSYCGQPWVQNATVRDNISFGSEFKREWYERVIRACSLTRDFEILPGGDQTEVGERGITLSGGQKARINLARAVYRDSDIILLDDVLSAVDAHVGKFIMDNCFLDLLKDKTRILATHQLSMITAADRVIFLDSTGYITVGTADELRKSTPLFDDLMKYNDHDQSEEEEVEENIEEEKIEELEEVKKKITENKKASGALIKAESKEEDAVKLAVYMSFIQYGTGFLKWTFIPLFIFLIILATFSQVFTNVWLSFWTSLKFKGRSEGFYIGIFVMLAVCMSLLNFAFYFILTVVVNRTSKNLHSKAVKSILHSPMHFFDSSPLGRILNRFTHDTDTLDNEFSDQTRLFLSSSTSVIGVFILIIIYLPWFAIALVGLFTVFLAAASYYRASAREIKRLDSLGRSKVFSHFSETLSGSATIVAYREQGRFLRLNEQFLNRMNSAYFLTLVNQRWLSIRLDGVGACLTIVVTMLCVTKQFKISASSVGLVVSSMLQIVAMMGLVVREMASVENNMNAVERIYQYAEELESEAPFHLPDTAPDPSWPSEGKINFNHVFMSYQPTLPPVLKDLNISVGKGEKIGICGRTGAGKSTIMHALYRLTELTSGSIEIDGIDISTLGLHELRSRLSIIPQDPVLFQGTVRSNIDPFGTASDTELWNALRRSWLLDSTEYDRVQNGTANNNVKFHLDEPVNDDGTNFSLGERQLLALTRALVRNTQILILDEATSSVDFHTDSKIQSTIAKEFAHCTILCIAHRLRTIINYDKILVLEAGEVVEYDSPINLFLREDGVFRSMCNNSGITVEDF
ncbi:hypothetical protein D0Z00_002631 [Geotrichum galactomycetum]|uniref:Uncharacterized protein n=1 Tax=Geotrichum galactomycetum TaxID=27317 RepID=A0ACB6V3R2_9ASCO|nr:hypothetical protein D0Z00_002631 [Geotrichum candidum]